MKKLFLFFIVVLISVNLFGQSAKFQSAYIYQFTNFIQWPATKKSGNFVITVVGKAEVAPFLTALAKSKKAGTQTIEVKVVKNVSEAKGSHMIYLSSGKLGEFDSAKKVATASKALLITEKNGYGKKGSAINFVFKNGKIKFELNKASLKSSGLKVNSKLEALGIVVG